MAAKPEILFIFPDYTNGNFSNCLGAAYIIAYLKQEGISARQFHSYKPSTIPQIACRILDSGAGIIGFSCYNTNYFLIKLLCKELKKRKPDIFIIAGGPTPTFSDRIVLRNIPEIDICVRGEGEFATKEIIENFKKGCGFDNISGISFYRDNKIIRTEDRVFAQNLASREYSLDALPSPYLNHILDPENIIKHDKEIPLITSRGCIFKCTYCNCTALSKHTVRYHSAERIIAELKLINDVIKEKNKRNVRIHDDCFTLNNKRITQICNGIIKNKIDLKIAITTRADYVDEKLLKLLYRAGVRRIGFGLETANPETLYRIKKIRLSYKKRNNFLPEKKFLKKLKDSVFTAKKIGFEVDISIILGLPGENLKNILKTINFVARLKNKTCYYNYLHAYPGTEIFDNLGKNNKKTSEKWLQLFLNTLPVNQISKIPLLSNANIAINKQDKASLVNAFLMGLLNKNIANKYAPAMFFLENRVPVSVLKNKVPLESTIFLQKGMNIQHASLAKTLNMSHGSSHIQYNMLGKYFNYYKDSWRWLNNFRLSDTFLNKTPAHRNIIFDISCASDVAEFENFLSNMPDFIHSIFTKKINSFILLDACRWTHHCPAKDPNRLIVNKKLCLTACFHGKIIGKLGDSFRKTNNAYFGYLESERKKRGCEKCPAKKHCSQCPFLGNIPYKTYCRIKRNYLGRIDKFIALLNIRNTTGILPK